DRAASIEACVNGGRFTVAKGTEAPARRPLPPSHSQNRRRERDLVTVIDPQPDQSIDWLLVPPPGSSTRHPDLDVHVAAVRAKSVVRAQIVLRQVTAARPNLSDLPRAASVDRDSRADAETVASCLLELNGHPVMPRSLPVIQHRGHIIHVADHHIEIAVVVEIADRESPTRLGDLQSGARGLRDVDEPACVVEEQLILLAEGLTEVGIVVDVGIYVPVGEEEIEMAVEIS